MIQLNPHFGSKLLQPQAHENGKLRASGLTMKSIVIPLIITSSVDDVPNQLVTPFKNLSTIVFPKQPPINLNVTTRIGAALKASANPHHDCFCFRCLLPINILELNKNGGLQVNFLSTRSAKQ